MGRKRIKRELVTRSTRTGQETVTYPITTTDAVIDDVTGLSLSTTLENMGIVPPPVPNRVNPIYTNGVLTSIEELMDDFLIKRSEFTYDVHGVLLKVVESSITQGTKTHTMNYENGVLTNVVTT